MPALVESPSEVAEGQDAEALFKEARWRERRRRLFVLGAVMVLLAGVGILYATHRATTAASHHKPAPTSAPDRVTATGGVSPEHPYGLALGPNGDLYVVDAGRDQILRRLRSGKFQVVAGDGKRGFSGDGGQAVDAELDLSYFSGIAIGHDGAVYFSDTGNRRVPRCSPTGPSGPSPGEAPT